MNCRHVQAHLSAYLDSELTGCQQQTIRYHLNHCTECAQEYRRLRSVKQLIGAMSCELPAAHCEERLIMQIRAYRFEMTAESPRKSWIQGLWPRVSFAAAATLALFFFASKGEDTGNTSAVNTLPNSLSVLSNSRSFQPISTFSTQPSWHFDSMQPAPGVSFYQANAWEQPEMIQQPPVAPIVLMGWR